MENLTEKYKKILLSNNIKDKVSQVIVTESGAKGDGMASVTQCITVKFEDSKRSPLHLFVKSHSDNPTHEAMLSCLKAFEKESRFFMEYLPAAKEFCKSKGFGDLLDFYPKCYFGDEKLIVLENIVIDKGYQLLAHDERHDFKTASMALKTLAKHHAVSYAMIQENGGADKFFQTFKDLDHWGMSAPMMVNMMTGFFENSVKTCTAIMQKNKIDGAENALEQLSNLKPAEGVIALERNLEDKKLMIISHGDFKNNNLMFLKNKESDSLEHLILIDLQGATYNSPVTDITGYLFTSIDPTVRQSRLPELLNIYRDVLNQVSKDLGYQIELSYEDLFMEYRKSFKYGFYFGMSMVGPGMGLVKSAGIDISKIDMADLANVFHECLVKWIDENPEKGRDMAEEIKCLLDEYNKLAI